MLKDNAHGIACLERLNGTKYFVRGNHDTDTRIEEYKKLYNVIEVVDAKFFNYKNYHFYMTHFPCICSNFDDGKTLKKRTINLCGHSHTTDVFIDWNNYNSAIYHCEVDCHDCYPIDIETIITEINTKYNQ